MSSRLVSVIRQKSAVLAQSLFKRPKSTGAVCFLCSSDLQAALSSSAPLALLNGFDVPQVPLSCPVPQFFLLSSFNQTLLFYLISRCVLPTGAPSLPFFFLFFRNKNKTLQVHPRDYVMSKSISSVQHSPLGYF